MHGSIFVFYNVKVFYLENATLNLLRLTEGSNEHVQEIIDLGATARLDLPGASKGQTNTW